MCLTTDGVAGDQLYQKLCDGNLAPYQQWNVIEPSYGWVELYNPWFDLAVDVYCNSNEPGAPIDAWHPNGQSNHYFWASALSPGYRVLVGGSAIRRSLPLLSCCDLYGPTSSFGQDRRPRAIVPTKIADGLSRTDRRPRRRSPGRRSE
jgi:hypothetical protein